VKVIPNKDEADEDEDASIPFGSSAGEGKKFPLTCQTPFVACRMESLKNLAVGVPVALTAVLLALSLPKRKKLSQRDHLVAGWYLFNGVIIHIFLDGLVGFGGQVPYLYEKYCELDKRYAGTGESSVMMISLVELTIMGPLCLAVFYAYYQGKRWRHVLEVLTCGIQIFGTVSFYLCSHSFISWLSWLTWI